MARIFRIGPGLGLTRRRGDAATRRAATAAAMERRTIREIMMRSGGSYDEARAEARERGLAR